MDRQDQKQQYFNDYNNRTHVIGRIVSAITLVLLVGAPFVIGTYLGAMPDMHAVLKGFLAVGIVWTVSSFVEFLVYTPMLGAGGGYLAFITGNLINMKIPCAMNAREIAGTRAGTPENEIISTLSIATSSLVTIVVLALTMICVATTMTAVVAERRREIGLRKALGASNGSIIAEFMGEGVVLGAFGGLLGAILGFAFAQVVSRNVFNSSIRLMPWLIPVTILASVVVTGIACLIPIRSATQVDPALVLKGE